MSVESKKADRKILAIFITIIAVLAALSGYLYYNYVSTVNAKEAQISSLTSENNILRSNVSALTNENNRLRNEISSLQSQIAYLNSRIADLENRVRGLEDIVYLRVRIVLDKDKTVNIPANSYTILRYSTPYAGYLRISFTATQGVYIWVGSSFTDEWYYLYPRDGYATSGSFIVPVLPGTTFIYIGSPSWFSGVTVTLTIEYVY
jgi:cell division protein FtsB